MLFCKLGHWNFFRAVQILCLQHNTCICKTYVSSIDLIELGLPKIHIYHIRKDLHKAEVHFLTHELPLYTQACL